MPDHRIERGLTMPLPLFWIAGAAACVAGGVTAWLASGDDADVDESKTDAGDERQTEQVAEETQAEKRKRVECWKVKKLHTIANRHPASARSPSKLTCADYLRIRALGDTPKPVTHLNLGGSGAAAQADGPKADQVERALDMFLPKKGPSDAEEQVAELQKAIEGLEAMREGVRARAMSTRIGSEVQSAPPRHRRRA